MSLKLTYYTILHETLQFSAKNTSRCDAIWWNYYMLMHDTAIQRDAIQYMRQYKMYFVVVLVKFSFRLYSLLWTTLNNKSLLQFKFHLYLQQSLWVSSCFSDTFWCWVKNEEHKAETKVQGLKTNLDKINEKIWWRHSIFCFTAESYNIFAQKNNMGYVNKLWKGINYYESSLRRWHFLQV